MSQRDYCHERGRVDIKHKYLKKSSTQFLTQWVKLAKCVFKQIPERVEYFVSHHDRIIVTLLSEPWFKIRMDTAHTFCSLTGQCQWSGEWGERRHKRSAEKHGSCLMCSDWPLSNTREECSTKKDWARHLMRRKLHFKRWQFVSLNNLNIFVDN